LNENSQQHKQVTELERENEYLKDQVDGNDGDRRALWQILATSELSAEEWAYQQATQ
jgi:hypothetical protein